jgi:hypothetical protein
MKNQITCIISFILTFLATGYCQININYDEILQQIQNAANEAINEANEIAKSDNPALQQCLHSCEVMLEDEGEEAIKTCQDNCRKDYSIFDNLTGYFGGSSTNKNITASLQVPTVDEVMQYLPDKIGSWSAITGFDDIESDEESTDIMRVYQNGNKFITVQVDADIYTDEDIEEDDSCDTKIVKQSNIQGFNAYEIKLTCTIPGFGKQESQFLLFSFANEEDYIYNLSIIPSSPYADMDNEMLPIKEDPVSMDELYNFANQLNLKGLGSLAKK